MRCVDSIMDSECDVEQTRAVGEVHRVAKKGPRLSD